jgi:hypothetical protein
VTRPNGHSDNGNVGIVQEPDGSELVDGVPIPPPAPAALPEFATRAKQRAKQQIQQNRFVIIGAGAIVMALLIFVAISMPHRGGPDKAKNRGLTSDGKSTLESPERFRTGYPHPQFRRSRRGAAGPHSRCESDLDGRRGFPAG